MRPVLRESCPITSNTQWKASKSEAGTVCSNIRARVKKEKQTIPEYMRTESDSPSLRRAHSRIAFKVVYSSHKQPYKIMIKSLQTSSASNIWSRSRARQKSPKRNGNLVKKSPKVLISPSKTMISPTKLGKNQLQQSSGDRFRHQVQGR